MRDRAAWSLLGSNLLTLALAVWQRWPLPLLLWPYWVQSVVIGWYARKRILAAPDYRIGGVPISIDGRQMRRGEWPQRRLANFFALHFGAFHLFYLVFITAFSAMDMGGALTLREWLTVMALSLPFVVTHAQSHREHVAADLAEVPTAARLMLLPYLRVVPMHLTIIFGFALASTDNPRWAIALFVGLKTIADLGLHTAEHHIMQRPAEASGARSHAGGVVQPQRRLELTGGAPIEQWRAVGCGIVFVLPFIASGVAVLIISVQGLWEALRHGTAEGDTPAGIYAAAIGAALVFMVLPPALMRLKAGPSPIAPPAERVAPRPGRETAAPRPGVSAPPEGRLGGTGIRIEQWAPGRRIQLRQGCSWRGSRGPLTFAALILLGLFVVVPSINGVLRGGAVRVGLPEETFFSILGSWALLGLLWAALPARRRRVEVDWLADAIRVHSGWRGRELGLSRVRGVESLEGGDLMGSAKGETVYQRLVVWIEPDAEASIPYLLVHTRGSEPGQAGEERRLVADLATALAGALGAPVGCPENARKALAPYA